MSFLKDLIAWKSRAAEPIQHDADFDADDDWLLEDDGDDAEDDLPPELAGLLDRDQVRKAPEPADDRQRQGDTAKAAPGRPAPAPRGEAVAPPDGAEDDLIARISRHHSEPAPAPKPAEAAPEVPKTRPVSQPGGPDVPSRRPATPPKIWELHGAPAPAQRPAVAPAPKAHPPTGQTAAPQPAAEPAEPAGRARTRLLGFHHPGSMARDPFEDLSSPAATTPLAESDPEAAIRFPTGWIVVIDGPGRGACFTLTTGVSQIGRGSDQAIRLDFGDQSISRKNHAAIAYDEELGEFFLGHGGKLNLVRLNGRPVLSTEPLNDCDVIRIGETTLKFVAFCNEDFTWSEDSDRGPSAATR